MDAGTNSGRWNPLASPSRLSVRNAALLECMTPTRFAGPDGHLYTKKLTDLDSAVIGILKVDTEVEEMLFSGQQVAVEALSANEWCESEAHLLRTRKPMQLRRQSPRERHQLNSSISFALLQCSGFV